MTKKSTFFIGKLIQKAAKLRGGGSSLPGLIVEKIDPSFTATLLKSLPLGVILVTGTNGKTTTTKIITELLESTGLKVFTNKTGSNFSRGIASSLLDATTKDGLLDYDIAVLELDEAHAVHFVRQVSPNYVIVLNVMRDQLDRFGEIDHTAKLVETVALSATKGVVLNKDDPRVAAIAKKLNHDIELRYFSVENNLLSLFVNDDALHTKMANVPMAAASEQLHRGDVMLHGFTSQEATYQIGQKHYSVTMKLSGVYNFLNSAGALALTKLVLKDSQVEPTELVEKLGTITPAFGRGEIITLNKQTIELILVKNPAGFRLALESFDSKNTAVMIAINDAYADGRDMSWLWDVDFVSLQSGVAAVSGIRAYDMALRLQYDNLEVGIVEPTIAKAIADFLQVPAPKKRIFCTYTAMLAVRKILKQHSTMKDVV